MVLVMVLVLVGLAEVAVLGNLVGALVIMGLVLVATGFELSGG